MSNKQLVRPKPARPAAQAQRRSDPVLDSIDIAEFVIGGSVVSPAIRGSNLDKDGLRVAILDEDGDEIPYADDPPPSPPPAEPSPYEVYLTNPGSDDDLESNAFRFSLKVRRGPASDHKVVLTTAEGNRKVALDDLDVFGDLPITFK